MAPRLIPTELGDIFPQRRTAGRHFSTAIHRVMKALHPQRFTDTPIDMQRALLGNAVEKAICDQLIWLHPDRYTRIDEIEFRDHYGHVDLIDVIDEVVWEIKLTWASQRRAEDPEDPWFWRYWAQGKAYALALGWHKVGLMWVPIVGDWKQDTSPKVFRWIDEFTDDELEENWSMIEAYSQDEEGQ